MAAVELPLRDEHPKLSEPFVQGGQAQQGAALGPALGPALAQQGPGIGSRIHIKCMASWWTFALAFAIEFAASGIYL